jgi:glycyl-tRNA synthetase
MFGTKLGASAESAMDLYLRPETAQGIFVNFLNVQKTGRMKIPFGIAQTGKAFRNEIVARQFIFRMREFEQMEMQFFVPPGTQKEWYEKWKETRLKWHLSLGMGEDNYRFHDHEKLAHYADAAADIEFKFPFGFKELEGIHSRTDFDLSSHEEFSGKKLQYFDPERNENYVPLCSRNFDWTRQNVFSDFFLGSTRRNPGRRESSYCFKTSGGFSAYKSSGTSFSQERWLTRFSA